MISEIIQFISRVMQQRNVELQSAKITSALEAKHSLILHFETSFDKLQSHRYDDISQALSHSVPITLTDLRFPTLSCENHNK